MSLPVMSGTARLIADPELRFSPSGVAVCKVRLAFNSRRKNEAGEWVDADSFFVTGTVFKDEAEHVVESLSKGLEVVVTGRLKTRTYADKDGQDRSAVDLMVDSIGPTLKYATVKVNKMQRKSAGEITEDDWADVAVAQPGQAAANADESRARGFDNDPPF